MKKWFLVSLLPILFCLNGCNGGKPGSPEDFTVTKLRSVGEPSPNPVNLSHCILPGSRETLESFRHVSQGRLYYMDYDIDFPFEDLIPETKDGRIAPNDYPSFMYKFNSTLVYLILSKCRTVSDVEEMMSKYDYVTMMNKLNTHWYVSDAEGDYAVFEYWGRGTEESPYKLYVMRRDERFHKTGNHTYYGVPYEYNSIENYYCNPEAAFAYNQDMWQYKFSNKVRVHHMMSAYKPVMTEKEALLCLQEGSFGIEEPGDVTNWSCVYNPSERTMLFNMRNDLSEVYSIDLKEDL